MKKSLNDWDFETSRQSLETLMIELSQVEEQWAMKLNAP